MYFLSHIFSSIQRTYNLSDFISKFLDFLPAFTHARTIGNLRRIHLGANFLSFLLIFFLWVNYIHSNCLNVLMSWIFLMRLGALFSLGFLAQLILLIGLTAEIFHSQNDYKPFLYF